MKTLFSDIYNKIRELFQLEKSENTSETATSRLQVILMHDRTKLDPIIMNKMREELVEVFSKYVVIDKEELEIGLKNEGDAVALMLNIPIVRAKTEEELEEIRKKLQEEEDKIVEDESDEDSDEDNTDEENQEENEEEDASSDSAETAEEDIEEDNTDKKEEDDADKHKQEDEQSLKDALKDDVSDEEETEEKE